MQQVKISECLEKGCVFPRLISTTKPEVLLELSEKLAEAITRLNAQKLNETLFEREEICSTAIDSGVAIPHIKLLDVPDVIMAFARSEAGVDFDSLDGQKTHLITLVIIPETRSTETLLTLLARISRILARDNVRAKLETSQEASDIYNLLIEEDEKL
ncbi:MAG: PTS sugar transporter subunit IIA [Candidatus Dadabacteria bacterium]|nr:PTS sugar transporter subunit IIA [Candidatus Dadabacteria bacterium]